MTSTATREVTIAADPKLPIIRISREFDASRDKVFRAHTDPELMVQWMGPRSTTIRIDRWDCRTGGSYRYVSTDASGEYGFFGSFHDVRSSESIVQTFTFEGIVQNKDHCSASEVTASVAFARSVSAGVILCWPVTGSIKLSDTYFVDVCCPSSKLSLMWIFFPGAFISVASSSPSMSRSTTGNFPGAATGPPPVVA